MVWSCQGIDCFNIHNMYFSFVFVALLHVFIIIRDLVLGSLSLRTQSCYCLWFVNVFRIVLECCIILLVYCNRCKGPWLGEHPQRRPLKGLHIRHQCSSWTLPINQAHPSQSIYDNDLSRFLFAFLKSLSCYVEENYRSLITQSFNCKNSFPSVALVAQSNLINYATIVCDLCRNQFDLRSVFWICLKNKAQFASMTTWYAQKFLLIASNL